MSLIVSPTPLVITIEFNEAAGQARYALNREAPLLQVLAVLTQITASLITSAIGGNLPAPNPGNNPLLQPGNNNGNA